MDVGGCIISRKRSTGKVCSQYSDEWEPYGKAEIAPGVYAHFCRAIDDVCEPYDDLGRYICFEWNVTTHDETVTEEEFEELKKYLPPYWPPL